MNDRAGDRPDRIAIDGHGFGWRVWDDQDYWSMVPTNPDNEPIPHPVTFYVQADEDVIQQAIEEWASTAGGSAKGGPTLAHYIAVKLMGG